MDETCNMRGVVTRGGKITVRILLVLTALTIFSGCDQAGPQQDEQEGA
jgi:hypothetical protein